MHDSRFGCEILISGNFPETAWRAIHSRQVAHANCTFLWCFWGQRLAVKDFTAKRRKRITKFWVSLLNCLVVMNFCQAMRVCRARFFVILGVLEEIDRGTQGG